MNFFERSIKQLLLKINMFNTTIHHNTEIHNHFRVPENEAAAAAFARELKVTQEYKLQTSIPPTTDKEPVTDDAKLSD